MVSFMRKTCSSFIVCIDVEFLWLLESFILFSCVIIDLGDHNYYIKRTIWRSASVTYFPKFNKEIIMKFFGLMFVLLSLVALALSIPGE